MPLPTISPMSQTPPPAEPTAPRRPLLAWLRRRLQGWRLRHQLPFNFTIHLIGIPMAVCGAVIVLGLWPAAVLGLPWPAVVLGRRGLRPRLPSPMGRPSRRGQRPRRVGRDQAPARTALRRHRPALEPGRPQPPVTPGRRLGRRPPRLPRRRGLTKCFFALPPPSSIPPHRPHRRQKFPLSTNRIGRYRPWHLRSSGSASHGTARDGGRRSAAGGNHRRPVAPSRASPLRGDGAGGMDRSNGVRLCAGR